MLSELHPSASPTFFEAAGETTPFHPLTLLLLSFVRVALPCYSLYAASYHDPLALPELPPRPALLLASSLLFGCCCFSPLRVLLLFFPAACAVVVVQLSRSAIALPYRLAVVEVDVVATLSLLTVLLPFLVVVQGSRKPQCTTLLTRSRDQLKSQRHPMSDISNVVSRFGKQVEENQNVDISIIKNGETTEKGNYKLARANMKYILHQKRTKNERIVHGKSILFFLIILRSCIF
ncbi:hypothetical protein BVRB_7g178690 [Beta vulgaris subsp. vulgaris]|uniref:Uncharacterized protein n=1 Tax=Beta vulgaris subsp. vulgaris TaxID=3555 RepID=A0A0J8BAV5_BETVV|nr:hypothetical protein BVRB_7g178690 [Beta vulgaris subsp. vulgaris]